MKSIGRLLCLALTLTGASLLWATNPASPQGDPRQTWQLLDYIAVDYPASVRNGEILSAAEYAEMREFATAVQTQLNSLPNAAGGAELASQAQRLAQAIDARAMPQLVAQLARGLAEQLLRVYPVPQAPTALPNLARGADLYGTQCSACHGAQGAGDGPVAPTLEPHPVAFTDFARARQRSPFGYFQIITQGLKGTSMASFATLPEADRWSLAFFVSTLAYTDAERGEGNRLWHEQPALHLNISNLEVLARSSEDQLAAMLGTGSAHAVTAYLRAHPEALNGDTAAGSLDLARTRLAQSLHAYETGQKAEAQRLALSAYLDGFEPLEPLVTATDPKLRVAMERAMGKYRAALGRTASTAEVRGHAQHIETLFQNIEQSLATTRTSATATFFGSFTILLREGLEALLIVVAILAFLVKAERADLLRYVHGGWIGALIAGVFTWAAATYLIDITGAHREITEGVSSLFAAAVLLSVGLWMHGKSLAGRWQEYLHAKLSDALSQRSAWFLAGLAFIAVYREVFETILFYAALWTQGAHRAIVAGLLGAALALVAVAFALLRATRRLPIGQFFAVSSVLIGVLAVVLVGKGVAALQEAGLVNLHPVYGPRITWLGIYPDLQALLAQLVVVVLAAAGVAYNRWGLRRSVNP